VPASQLRIDQRIPHRIHRELMMIMMMMMMMMMIWGERCAWRHAARNGARIAVATRVEEKKDDEVG